MRPKSRVSLIFPRRRKFECFSEKSSRKLFLTPTEYVAKYDTKEAAEAAADDSSSDEISSVESFTEEEAPGLEL